MSSTRSSTRSSKGRKRKSDTENKLPVDEKVKKSTTEADGKKLTPWDAFQKNIDDFMEAKGYLGSMLVKGLDKENKDSDDDDEEEEDVDTTKVTNEQIQNLRYIMITSNREKDLDAMEKLVLGEQYGDSVLMFNTRFSNEIMQSWYFMRNKITKMKKPSQKFDILFAYTYWLKYHDCWMHDNEGGMEVLTKGLASAWKKLLSKSDEDLEIDVEYTKPAIMELLEQFRKEVESVDMYGVYPLLKFKYK